MQSETHRARVDGGNYIGNVALAATVANRAQAGRHALHRVACGGQHAGADVYMHNKQRQRQERKRQETKTILLLARACGLVYDCKRVS